MRSRLIKRKRIYTLKRKKWMWIPFCKLLLTLLHETCACIILCIHAASFLSPPSIKTDTSLMFMMIKHLLFSPKLCDCVNALDLHVSQQDFQLRSFLTHSFLMWCKKLMVCTWNNIQGNSTSRFSPKAL